MECIIIPRTNTAAWDGLDSILGSSPRSVVKITGMLPEKCGIDHTYNVHKIFLVDEINRIWQSTTSEMRLLYLKD